MQICFDIDSLFDGVKACASIAYGIYCEHETYFVRRMEALLKDAGYDYGDVSEKELAIALTYAQQIVLTRMPIPRFGDEATFVQELYRELCRIESGDISTQNASHVMQRDGKFVYATLNNFARPYLEIVDRFALSLFQILASGFTVLRHGPRYLPFFRIDRDAVPQMGVSEREMKKATAVLGRLDRKQFARNRIQRAVSAVEVRCFCDMWRSVSPNVWQGGLRVIAYDALKKEQDTAALWHSPGLI